MGENIIRCDCGKLIAVERDGRIFVWCRRCKKEVELDLIRDNELPKQRYDTIKQ